jgi:hypothetical protein
VFSAFLRDLAAVGTETEELAHAAREVWPTLFAHVLDEVEANAAIYDRSDSFNGYALSYLLLNHPETTQSMDDEFGRHTFKWVHPDELVELLPRWLPYAAGRSSCLLELIRFLRQLPTETQVTESLGWLDTLCLSRPDRQLVSYAPMDEWLIEIKPEADARGAGGDWLNLVDRLVYAGNKLSQPTHAEWKMTRISKTEHIFPSIAGGGVPGVGVVSRLGCHVENVVSHRAMVSENCLGISRKDTYARWLLTSLPSSSCSGN